jgi:long-chain-fatty-acid--[acyl-carrier-protein] ligase
VVLFTSGSESLPKAVPLTHRNLLTNVRGGLPVLEVRPDDAILGFLPPFHSFGVTACTLLPVLSGVRAVYHPDPTDARSLVRLAAQYRATILFTTPTFLGHMFSAAEADDLKSLRVIVTGAEKCPHAIFETARQRAPGAEIIEGYGITECSPVVSVNRLGRAREGSVGQPLEGVEVRVVDPESGQALPPGATGILLVSGPSVFPGYIKHDGPEPFVELEGRRWYNTGDLVQVDGDRFLRFQGRLKRFLKAGGEMISLPALEEPLAALYPPTDQGPRVAVEGVETPSGRWIVLFATEPLSLREANARLAEAGFRGVMRLDEVVQVESVPVLGTGKTDYKQLRALVAERARSREA